jgi:hypothetical protein
MVNLLFFSAFLEVTSEVHFSRGFLMTKSFSDLAVKAFHDATSDEARKSFLFELMATHRIAPSLISAPMVEQVVQSFVRTPRAAMTDYSQADNRREMSLDEACLDFLAFVAEKDERGVFSESAVEEIADCLLFAKKAQQPLWRRAKIENVISHLAKQPWTGRVMSTRLNAFLDVLLDPTMPPCGVSPSGVLALALTLARSTSTSELWALDSAVKRITKTPGLLAHPSVMAFVSLYLSRVAGPCYVAKPVLPFHEMIKDTLSRLKEMDFADPDDASVSLEERLARRKKMRMAAGLLHTVAAASSGSIPPALEIAERLFAASENEAASGLVGSGFFAAALPQAPEETLAFLEAHQRRETFYAFRKLKGLMPALVDNAPALTDRALNFVAWDVEHALAESFHAAAAIVLSHPKTASRVLAMASEVSGSTRSRDEGGYVGDLNSAVRAVQPDLFKPVHPGDRLEQMSRGLSCLRRLYRLAYEPINMDVD